MNCSRVFKVRYEDNKLLKKSPRSLGWTLRHRSPEFTMGCVESCPVLLDPALDMPTMPLDINVLFNLFKTLVQGGPHWTQGSVFFHSFLLCCISICLVKGAQLSAVQPTLTSRVFGKIRRISAPRGQTAKFCVCKQ